MRSLIDAGVVAPIHSDAPVCEATPFLGIRSLVNLRTAEGGDLDASQAIGVAEALSAATVLGAWAGREEGAKGARAPGMFADLCLVDREPFAIDKADRVRLRWR